jgi:hypothetical protein
VSADPPLFAASSEAPRSLRIWNGAETMDRQKYSGLVA